MKHASTNIILVPEGGLANRMRAVGAAVSLARDADRRLTVLWHKDSGLNAGFEDIFKRDRLPFSVKNVSVVKHFLTFEAPRKRNFYLSAIYQCVAPYRIVNHLAKRPSELKDSDLLHSILDRPRKETVIVSGDEFYPYTPGDITESFQFSDVVNRRKESILKGTSPRVAFHIRRTDNARSIEFSPLHLFKEAIRDELKNNEDSTIFVATDDEGVKSELQSMSPERIVTNESVASRNTLQGIVDAAAEMSILADCDSIYGSYWSSFSEMAAMIGSAKLKILKKSLVKII